MAGTPGVRTSLEAARRLVVTKQRLAGPLPARPDREAILSVVRDLGYVQWDPVTVVAPSHHLSLWARLGPFRPADLERLLWEERRAFEHWMPMASLVLTEDYPVFASLMERYPESLTRSWGNQRTRAKQFLAAHAELRGTLLRELRDGPRSTNEFAEHSKTKRRAGEWSFSSAVSQMLYHLTMQGEVMVVGHRGNQNLWGLTGDFLPASARGRALGEEEFELTAAERATRALGVATPREITLYFVRGRYSGLRRALDRLERDSKLHRVVVDGADSRETRYVHEEDLPALEAGGAVDWEPRMSLLPPFDNLLFSQDRGRRLFGFDYVREQFLPKAKRRYGLYVLPILWGDRLIGRIDPRHDKTSGELVINAIHAEPGAPAGREVAEALRETIERLAKFVGADAIRYPSRVPGGWHAVRA